MRRYILMLMLVMGALSLMAQEMPNAIVVFRDTSDATYRLIQLEDPDYPVNTPVEERWLILAYLSEDDKIDPLDAKGNPTGNDIVNPYLTSTEKAIEGQVTNGLLIGPEEIGYRLGFGGAVVTPEHFGKYVYIRIFNAHKLEDATKYMVLHTPILVEGEGPQSTTIIPDYGWDMDPVWKWIEAPREY